MTGVVQVLTVELVVRDERGESVDPALLGLEGLVELLRAHPPDDATAPDSELGRAVRVWGAARLTLEAVEQVVRQVAAVRAACVAAVGRDCPDGLSGERVLDELACSLVVSRRSAQHTRAVAGHLDAHPEAWAALARGEVDLTRARIVAEALGAIPGTDPDGVPRPSWAAEYAALQAEGLAYAQEHTARRLELFLRRRLLALGCTERPARRRRGLAERGVWISHDGEGTGEVTARLASEDAERVYATLRAVALADRSGDPTHDCESPREPLDAWLAAAFVDLVLWPAGGAPRHGNRADGTQHGWGASDPRPGATPDSATGPQRAVRVDTVINVTIPIESLAGLSEDPGVINGFGVIPAEVARRLAAGDARWRHVLTCRSSGAVLDVGTLSYRPPAALDRHVRLRDGTCRFPGCTVPARECDLDHLIPFPRGSTSAENLHALCRRHHALKHDGGWQVSSGPGQSLTWTSPLGATATSYPDDSLGSLRPVA
jgi:hypothetical protein